MALCNIIRSTMNSHTVFAILGFVLLGSCALDIPASPPPPAAEAPEYDVSSEGGAVVHHYSGAGVLLWIERHTLSVTPPDLRLKTYHYTAQNTLQWYEYRRFEQFGTSWLKTRELRYSPPKDAGTLSFAKAWAYSAGGTPIWAADYVGASSLFQHDWFADGTTTPLLQRSSYNEAGTPQRYERYQYVAGKETGRAVLDGSKVVQEARLQSYDGENLIETLSFTKAATSTWNRATHTFLPSSTTEYRRTWYEVAAATPPAVPGIETATPLPPGASTDSTSATFNPDTTNALDPVTKTNVLTNVPQLLAFPVLNEPSSWDLSTLQAVEYDLPGALGGKTTLRFERSQLNPLIQLPRSLVRAAEGVLGQISMDFVWNAENQLIQRVVSYQQNPVLTIDLTRDGSGRITRIDTAGSMMKIPLTYTLTYVDEAATRPQTLSLSTSTLALLTLTFTYSNAAPAPDPLFGLGVLNFDAQVQSIQVTIDGTGTPVPALNLVFAAVVTNSGVTTRSVEVFDIVGAGSQSMGLLTWSTNTTTNQTNLVWNPVLAGAPDWTYTYSWGKWAAMAAGINDTAEETAEQLKTRASQAMTLADSFDFEKIFQLVNAAQAQLPSVQEQLTRSAETLIDQVQAAAQN